jgi:hypothetical protein
MKNKNTEKQKDNDDLPKGGQDYPSVSTDKKADTEAGADVGENKFGEQ